MPEKIDRENDIVGIQQANILPFARWEGKEHQYALTVDIADLTKPDAKINIVVDKQIVKTVAVQDMIQGYFNL